MRTVRSFVILLAALGGACGTSPSAAPSDDGSSSHALSMSTGGGPVDCAEPSVHGQVGVESYRPDTSAIVADIRARAVRGVPFDPDSLPVSDAVPVRVVVGPSDLRSTRAGTYAELMLDDVRVQIVNTGSPSARPAADLVLDVGTRGLRDLPLVASYRPNGAGAFDVAIAAEPDATGGGTGIPLGPQWFASEGGCLTDAFGGLQGRIPQGMPPIVFPPISGTCTDQARCAVVRGAWARAHIETFWANLMIEYIDAMPEPSGFNDDRQFAWSARGRDPQGELTDASVAPSWWFGEYRTKWFGRISSGVRQVWDVFKSGTHRGTPLTHYCPTTTETNACNTVREPSAHQIDHGEINYCNRWFNRDETDRIRLSIHEPMHWLFVEDVFGNESLAVLDLQLHRHGMNCDASPALETIYGADEAHHLGSYFNDYDDDCSHREIATRTVDVYAQMIHNFGGPILRGEMVKWPSPADPTPHPPQCEKDGVEGCRCLPTGGNHEADGDWRPDEYCPDDGDVEVVCVKTRFNAAETTGICTRCVPENGRMPAGCPCHSDNECAIGTQFGDLTCYGEETQGGHGVGRCYAMVDPPVWPCMADCKALFWNDPGATCVTGYDTWGGRCFPSECPPWERDACEDDHGICHLDTNEQLTCGSECNEPQECEETLGYPPGFECVDHFCRFTGT